MPHSIIWSEVIGKDADALAAFYRDLFGWSSEEVGGGYHMVKTASDDERPSMGIGADPSGGDGHVTFYVEVDDLQAKLDDAERLGGGTVMPPNDVMGTAIALFRDPEGHVVGLVNPGEPPEA